MNVQVILEKIKNGDKQELASIYKAYRLEFISWITSNYQCNEEEAKDVYQLSILALYENIINGKLQELSSSLKTYLFAVGKNKVLELRKSDKKYTNEFQEAIFNIPEVEDWENEIKERGIEAAKKCLEKLGDPCKSLLELYYFHGLSMEEISDRLRYKNRDTTKNLKYKCLNRLRKLFKEEMTTINKNEQV